MKLSEFFTLEEMTASQTATRRSIPNEPTPADLENLKALTRKLDEVRRLLGRPVVVDSGFRCKKLNDAVGSNDRSSHLVGLAADIRCPGFGKTMDVFEKIRNSGVNFDQLIAEFPMASSGGWVHFGIGPKNRRECLIYDGKHYSEVV